MSGYEEMDLSVAELLERFINEDTNIEKSEAHMYESICIFRDYVRLVAPDNDQRILELFHDCVEAVGDVFFEKGMRAAIKIEEGFAEKEQMRFEKIKLTEAQHRFYENCIRELLCDDKVQSMGNYIQHGKVNCLEHCMAVANLSYRVACYYHLHVDLRSLIRGAMLHDYFLYDWHVKSEYHRLHGFTHPGRALNNALQDFELNEIEQDIIKKHMWPLTVAACPRCKEAALVNFMDKYCSFLETVCGRRRSIWNEVLK